jgi:hypothetical protein
MREGELDARVEELEMERDELLDRTEELSAMVDDEKSLLEQFEANFKKEYKVRVPKRMALEPKNDFKPTSRCELSDRAAHSITTFDSCLSYDGGVWPGAGRVDADRSGRTNWRRRMRSCWSAWSRTSCCC